MFVNQDWFDKFNEVGLIHLSMFNYDHCPLWIHSGDNLVPLNRPKPFRFLVAWLGHESFTELVHNSC